MKADLNCKLMLNRSIVASIYWKFLATYLHATLLKSAFYQEAINVQELQQRE